MKKLQIAYYLGRVQFVTPKPGSAFTDESSSSARISPSPVTPLPDPFLLPDPRHPRPPRTLILLQQLQQKPASCLTAFANFHYPWQEGEVGIGYPVEKGR